MMGPETISEVSPASAADAPFEVGREGAGAALVMEDAMGLSSPQLAAKKTAPMVIVTTRLRILPSTVFLPPQPVPRLRIRPQKQPSEKHIARGIPSDANLAPAFHARSNGAIAIGHSHTCIKDRRLVNCLGFGANDHHVATERPCGVAVQFDHCFLAHLQQTRIDISDSHIYNRLRGIHDFRKGVARLK